MKIDVSEFSKKYRVRLLGSYDVAEILSLCEGNPQFYEHCPPFVTEQSIIDDMKALPPRKDYSDKYYVGYFDGEKLIAVMDFIMAFPDERTAFIGFFMTDASVQNAGVGSGIIGELCGFLRGIGISAVRLGWIDSNPQAKGFWQKNRFVRTGLSYDTENYTVTVAERILN